jgi:hypothetical protein
VEGDITVAKKQEPRTKRGQKLLEAMMVNRNLVQDKTKAMEVVGADVEALYPSLSDYRHGHEDKCLGSLPNPRV